MGESADRKSKSKLTVHVLVTREELVGFLLYLTAPAQGPQGPYFRGTKTRKERKDLERALEQLGVLDVWDAAGADGIITEEARGKIPERELRRLTFEAVDTLLGLMTDMNHAQGLRLRHLERRLEDAKDGKHGPEVVEDAEPPADDAAPAAEKSVLAGD